MIKEKEIWLILLREPIKDSRSKVQPKQIHSTS